MKDFGDGYVKKKGVTMEEEEGKSLVSFFLSPRASQNPY
jgi:hypothetical protein